MCSDVLAAVWSAWSWVWASMGGLDRWAARVRIMSPVQGAKCKGEVEVQYDLAKGSHATHVHCFVDGSTSEDFRGSSRGSPGEPDEIKVVAASHDHRATAAGARVTIEVE